MHKNTQKKCFRQLNELYDAIERESLDSAGVQSAFERIASALLGVEYDAENGLDWDEWRG